MSKPTKIKSQTSKNLPKQKGINKKSQKKLKKQPLSITQNQSKVQKISLRSSKLKAQQSQIKDKQPQKSLRQSKKQEEKLVLKQSKKSTMKNSTKSLKTSKKQQQKKGQIVNEQKDHKQQQPKSVKLIKKFRTKSIIQQLQKFHYEQSFGKYKVTLHSTYQIDESHKLYKQIKNLLALYLKKQKSKNQMIFQKSHYTFYPTFQFLLNGEDPSHSKCSICQFEFENIDSIQNLQKQLVETSQNDIVALRCGHLLHLQCLKMLIGKKQWFKCPICSTIYGKMIGDQPPGDMTWTVYNDMHCQSYQSVGTIVIHYSMKSGKKGDISFPGTGRTAYLPNNIQGNQVLSLLKQAFDRKLVFTIGRSVTTGRDNQVVWNGIHHKTNLTGGSAYFGYPDPTYFTRVKEELAAKGIF